MNKTFPRIGVSFFVFSLLLVAMVAPQSTLFAQMGTAFTYQGRLNSGSAPANGAYDLSFALFGSVSGADQVGSTLTNAATAVSNGLFTVTLDFGAGAFPGTNRWLQVGVRTNGGAVAYVLLTPRQSITPSPYAIFAANAANAATASTANGVAANAVTGPGLQNAAITAPKIAAGQVVKSLNGLADIVTLSAGANVTLTTSGNNLQLSAVNGWDLGGNGGTIAGPNFIGTTDNQPLELKINNTRSLRLEPGTNSVNVIGGFPGNFVSVGVEGATIGGGGTLNFPGTGLALTNSVTAASGTISGGAGNTVSGQSAAVGGGYQNTAGGPQSTVAGGVGNFTGPGGFIGGGGLNTNLGGASVIGGGQYNLIAGPAYNSVIGGGYANTNTGNTTADD